MKIEKTVIEKITDNGEVLKRTYTDKGQILNRKLAINNDVCKSIELIKKAHI